MPFVRQAVPADFEELASFDEWNAATEESILAGECFVAGHDRAVLAYGIFNHSFFKRPFIATIFVHPEYRKTGLGSALIQHAESLVGSKQLWISTNIENLAMQRTLQNLGFRLSGVVNNLGKLPELFYFKNVDSGES